MADLSRLTEEIYRIINAPYAVSLKRLDSILATVDDVTIHQWTEVKACQIAPLASAFINAYDEFPFVASIVATFARSLAFRDSVIEQDPEILEKLCKVDKDEALDDHTKRHSNLLASVSLLSDPLPTSAALPATIAILIQELVRRVVARPSMNYIRDIYQVMQGQSTNLLDYIPRDTFDKFASTCNRILRDNSDHKRSVLCLAIYALVAKEASVTSTTPSPNSFEGTQSSRVIEDWRHSTKRLFVGDKAGKTVALTVVRVLHFCSEDRQFSVEEALEGLQLCTHIIEAIDRTTIVQWIEKNIPVLRKLEERLCSPKVQKEIAIAGFRVYAKMKCFDQRLCSYKALLDIGTNETDDNIHSVEEVLPIAIRRSQPGRAISPRSFFDMKRAVYAVSTLRENVSNCAALAAHITNYAAMVGMPVWWNLDVFGLEACSGLDDECGVNQCCSHEFEKLRLSLSASISSLVIEAALSPVLDLSSDVSHLPATLLPALMQQIRKPGFAEARLRCSYNDVRHKQQGSRMPPTPYTVSKGSYKWRGNLERDLRMVSSHSYDLIVAHVNSICRDFESRCNTVEEPLLEAVANATRLQNELNASNAELASTLQQNVELQELVSQAEHLRTCETNDRLGLQECLNAAVEREVLLTRALSECQRNALETQTKSLSELADIRLSAKDAADVLHKSHQTTTLDLRQQLTVEVTKVTRLELEATWLRDDAANTTRQLRESESHKAELNNTLRQHSETIVQAQEQVRNHAKVLADNDTTIASLIEGMKSQAEILDTKCNQLRCVTEEMQQQKSESQRLNHDLRMAKAFKARVLATINHSTTDGDIETPSPANKENYPPLYSTIASELSESQ